MLEADLGERRYLGDSPREELMYEVIDRLLADRRAARRTRRPAAAMTEMKEEAVTEIRQLWEKEFGPGEDDAQP